MSRPSRSKGSPPPDESNPIRGITLKIKVAGLGKPETEQLRKEKGFSLKQVGKSLSITIAADTPEEALERIAKVGALLSPKR